MACPAGTSWRPGGACLVWIQAALASLDADLAARYGPGARVVYQKGPALEALQRLAAAVNAGAVYFNKRRVAPLPFAALSLHIPNCVAWLWRLAALLQHGWCLQVQWQNACRVQTVTLCMAQV
jgi:hypothetical protein